MVRLATTPCDNPPTVSYAPSLYCVEWFIGNEGDSVAPEIGLNGLNEEYFRQFWVGKGREHWTNRHHIHPSEEGSRVD